MPGNKDRIELQGQFWQRAIVETGLEPYTDLCVQANGFTNKEYPPELVYENSTDDIAVKQYNHSKWRVRDGYQPKPYTHAYLDYEPHKRELSGPESSWQWLKQSEGYDDDDTHAVWAMLRGVQMTTDGLSMGMYRTPILPERELALKDTDKAKTATPIIKRLGWVWMHCYDQGVSFEDGVQIFDYFNQINDHYATLSAFGKPIVPFIWPSHGMSESVADQYARLNIEALKWYGFDHMGVWVDLNHASSAEKQTNNMIKIAPRLLAEIERRGG